MSHNDQDATRTSFTQLTADEIRSIDSLLSPRADGAERRFDAGSGSVPAAAPVRVGPGEISSVTSIRRHGAGGDTPDEPATTFTSLSPDEIHAIEAVLVQPRGGDAGRFDPGTGQLAGQAPIVRVGASEIASVTSIRRHGAHR